MKQTKLSFAVFGIALLAALFAASPLPAVAETGSGSSNSGRDQERRDKPESEDDQDETEPEAHREDEADTPDDSDGRPERTRTQQEKPSTVTQERRGKLDDNGRTLCEQRRGGMRQSAAAINQALAKHYDRFTQINMRLTDFIASEQLTVADYEDLRATIDQAEIAAETAIEAARNTPEVNCEGDQPRVQAAQNRATFVAARESLKTYRDAIKALVSATKEAAKQESSDDNQ